MRKSSNDNKFVFLPNGFDVDSNRVGTFDMFDNEFIPMPAPLNKVRFNNNTDVFFGRDHPEFYYNSTMSVSYKKRALYCSICTKDSLGFTHNLSGQARIIQVTDQVGGGGFLGQAVAILGAAFRHFASKTVRLSLLLLG